MSVVFLSLVANFVRIEQYRAKILAVEISQSDPQKGQQFVSAPQLWRAITRDHHHVGQFCWKNTVVLRNSSIKTYWSRIEIGRPPGRTFY